MVRLTLQVQMVLTALAAVPESELYGLELVDSTGLPPGTIYPILARLEHAGWLSSRWEVVDQRAEGRPRRRYYRLTADGAAVATAVREKADARGRARRPLLPGSPLLGGAQ
jgi:DNA-binding PadR family transcriptional regulator